MEKTLVLRSMAALAVGVFFLPGLAFADAKVKKENPAIQFSPDPEQDFAKGGCAKLFTKATHAERRELARATLLFKGRSPGASQLTHAWNEYKSLATEEGGEFFQQEFLDILMQALPNLPWPFSESAVLEILEANRADHQALPIQKRRLQDVTSATRHYLECRDQGGCKPYQTRLWQLLAWQLGIIHGWHKVDFDKGSATSEGLNSWFLIFDEFSPALREKWMELTVDSGFEVQRALRFLEAPSVRAKALSQVDPGKLKNGAVALQPAPAPTPAKANSDQLRQLEPLNSVYNSVENFMTEADQSARRLREGLLARSEKQDLHSGTFQFEIQEKIRLWLKQSNVAPGHFRPLQDVIATPKRLELHMLLAATHLLERDVEARIARFYEDVFGDLPKSPTFKFQDLDTAQFRDGLLNPEIRQKFYAHEDRIIPLMNYIALLIRLSDTILDDEQMKAAAYSDDEASAFVELLKGIEARTGAIRLIASSSMFAREASSTLRNFLTTYVLEDDPDVR